MCIRDSNIFLPQQGLHDGNDQRGGIAVNNIDLLHGVQLESFAEQRIQKQKYNVEQVNIIYSNAAALVIPIVQALQMCIRDSPQQAPQRFWTSGEQLAVGALFLMPDRPQQSLRNRWAREPHRAARSGSR